MEGFMGFGVDANPKYTSFRLPGQQVGNYPVPEESQAEARQSLRAEIETLEKTVSLLEDAFSALVSGMAPLLRTQVDVPANYRDREEVSTLIPEKGGSEYVGRVADATMRLRALQQGIARLLDASAL
jgi:hypothetical protein